LSGTIKFHSIVRLGSFKRKDRAQGDFMNEPSEPGFKPERFSNLNATGQTGEYVSYLEQTGSRLRAVSRARYGLLNLKAGDRVLDVGCGLGDDARELSALVAPGGQVIAVDASEAMIAEARRRSNNPGQSVEFMVGDAHALEFADGAFAACWSERVLQHLADPAGAVSQMVRVTRPGGRIVVFEPDHSTLVIDAADRAATRTMVLALADAIRSSWIGRSLFGLFLANGLADVTIIPTPIISHSLSDTNALLRLDATAKAAISHGLLSEDAVSDWFADLKQREASGRFFGCLLCFAAAGTKPQP
jgi:ubiquinone/menaquinone biosynthesis C-methylase UbiE